MNSGKNPTYEILSDDEVSKEFSTLADGHWQLSADGIKITRTFKCRNWQGAIDFINDASKVAESNDVSHHPDIHLTMYRVIEIVCRTHATGNTCWCINV